MHARIASALLIAAAPLAGLAAEQPPASRAGDVLGAQVHGPNYTVDPHVQGDGFMHVFRLRTASGVYEVRGDSLMRVRLRELAALRQLGQMSESEEFTRSLGREAGRPLRFATDLFNDPEETLASSASGIANMFVRVAGFPLNRSRDGRIYAVFPFDELAWTDTTARAFGAATAELRRGGATPTATLAITGTTTAMAQAELASLGWTVTRLQ